MRPVIFCIFYLLALDTFGQLGKIEPFDQSLQEPTLVQFIERLKTAVKIRDKEHIRTIIASESYIPFEGGETTTPEEFFTFYFERSDHSYSIWEALEYSFSIGGGGFGTSKNSYYIPYTSANLHDSEPFTELGSYIIALSASTPIYERPSGNSKIISTLNYDIIQVDFEEYQANWETVILNNGTKGYVKSSDVIYTIDTRCAFVKEEGNWKLKSAGPFE